MKEISLTKGLVSFVDDEDYEYLNQYKWYAHKSRNTFYAERECSGKVIKMHRFILNAPEGLEVDHRNRNGLDNRKSNIWICTYQENMCNKRVWGKVPLRGVYWDKQIKKYRARIQHNGKSQHLGLFNTPELANEAYRQASIELRGYYIEN